MIWPLLGATLLASCLTVDGDRIRAGDLAPAWEALAGTDAAYVIGLAPAPGARRIFRAPELARLAARLGVAGAPEGLCVERRTRRLDRTELEPALARAVADPGARIEVLDFSRHPVPAGELEFPAGGAGLAAGNSAVPFVWRGLLRYQGRSVPVWARVRVSLRRRVVVARQDLPAGVPIAQSSLDSEERDVFRLSGPPLADVAEAAGKAPRRSIRRGAVLEARLLEEARTVYPGDRVRVEVTSGGAELQLEARAETGGRVGDRVIVSNPAGGRRFRAVVMARGRVSVDAEEDLDGRGAGGGRGGGPGPSAAPEVGVRKDPCGAAAGPRCRAGSRLAVLPGDGAGRPGPGPQGEPGGGPGDGNRR